MVGVIQALVEIQAHKTLLNKNKKALRRLFYYCEVIVSWNIVKGNRNAEFCHWQKLVFAQDMKEGRSFKAYRKP